MMSIIMMFITMIFMTKTQDIKKGQEGTRR